MPIVAWSCIEFTKNYFYFLQLLLSTVLLKIKKKIIFVLMARRNLWPFTYGDFFWYERWFVVCLKHVEKIIRKHSPARYEGPRLKKHIKRIHCYTVYGILGIPWRPWVLLPTTKKLYMFLSIQKVANLFNKSNLRIIYFSFSSYISQFIS